MTALPRLYQELAEWWPLLSSPDEYVEEATTYARVLRAHARRPVRTVIELGSGGGNNASHMKAWFDLTLVDPSEGMLEHSRRLNPECEHHVGDMRDFRIGREFDAVFIHDAIDYMTTLEELQLAFRTAFVHCRSGGVALFAPDHIRELFQPQTDCGGADGPERALRYLEWTWDPNPHDFTYVTDYAYLLRYPDGETRVAQDRHIGGLFERQAWLDSLTAVGFDPECVPFEHTDLEPGSHVLFVGRKP